MADIQVQIKEKYGIDIEKTNLFKLYKLDNDDISSQDLEQKFAEARKRWLQGVNGANEKNAKRDALRLENADKYEAILRDVKLRKLLKAFYHVSSNDTVTLDIAKQYFSLLASSKHYGRRAKEMENDFEFFRKCFPEANKKDTRLAILKMLETEYKIKGHIEVKEDVGEVENFVEEKNGTEKRIRHRFDKETIFAIRNLEEQMRAAVENEELRNKEPALQEALYKFLHLDDMKSLDELKSYIKLKREESFNNYQEKGQVYNPLVVLYNGVDTLLEYQDVIDNWDAFKLMVQYSKITPYMYGLEVVKENTLKQLYGIASQNYLFRDINDFLIIYFIPIYDHFKMQVHPIKKLLDKAKTKTASNKIFNAVEDKLGITKGAALPWYIMMVHGLVYFPVYISYFVFELIKEAFVIPKRFTIISSIITVIAMCSQMFADASLHEGFISLLEIVGEEFVGVVLLTVLCAMFAHELCIQLNMYCDWIGIEKTFLGILKKVFDRSKAEYVQIRNEYIGKKVPKIISNIICVVLLCLIIWAM